MPAKPRLLIAVQPRLFGFMLATVLTQMGTDDVVNIDLEAMAGADYDAALITGIPPADMTATVMIELPHQGNAGIGEITSPHMRETVVIDGLDTVLELLDRHCPGPVTRRLLHEPGDRGTWSLRNPDKNTKHDPATSEGGDQT